MSRVRWFLPSILIAALLASSLGVAKGHCDVLRLSAAETAAAIDGAGVRFSLDILVGRQEVCIDDVVLQWNVGDAGKDERCEYAAFLVTARNATTISEEELAAKDEIAAWSLEPEERLRTGSLVRFDLTDLVRSAVYANKTMGWIVVKGPGINAAGAERNAELVVRWAIGARR